MASLIDNLIDILDRERDAYEELLNLSTKKTPVIVKGDLQNLQQIMDDEQLVVSKINKIEHERMSVMGEIAGVLNTDVETLKLKDLIIVLERRPVEKEKLEICHDRLQTVVYQMKRINEHNQTLIQNALEMTQFEMKLIQSMKSAPETANYSKNAFNSGSLMGVTQGRFDAKQ